MRDQDLIITLVILAVSGLSTLLQKKRQARSHGELPGQPHSPPVPSAPSESTLSPSEPKPFDLEEQLRRILEGDQPAAPTVPTPPLIEPTRPIPPPLPKAAPLETLYSETEEPAARAMGQLPEAAQAYLRAAQLPEATAAHLRRIDEATEHARPASSDRPRRVFSPVAGAAIAQLRTPRSTQQAFVTAMILGPPKAFASSEN